jgi:hypothetical protein
MTGMIPRVVSPPAAMSTTTAAMSSKATTVPRTAFVRRSSACAETCSAEDPCGDASGIVTFEPAFDGVDTVLVVVIERDLPEPAVHRSIRDRGLCSVWRDHGIVVPAATPTDVAIDHCASAVLPSPPTA